MQCGPTLYGNCNAIYKKKGHMRHTRINTGCQKLQFTRSKQRTHKPKTQEIRKIQDHEARNVNLYLNIETKNI